MLRAGLGPLSIREEGCDRGVARVDLDTDEAVPLELNELAAHLERPRFYHTGLLGPGGV